MSLEKAVKNYVSRGFGSMTKNDFEVWIMNYLLYEQGYSDKSNYEISLELRIPETKVKRLRYEADLKYASESRSETYYNQQLDKILSNAQFKNGDNNQFKFLVEDVSLRKYIENKLKSKGRFADSSFNSEIVVISLDDLSILLDETWEKAQKNEVFKKAESATKKQHLSMRDLLDEYLKSAANQAGKKTVDLSMSAIKLFILSLI